MILQQVYHDNFTILSYRLQRILHKIFINQIRNLMQKYKTDISKQTKKIIRYVKKY